MGAKIAISFEKDLSEQRKKDFLVSVRHRSGVRSARFFEADDVSRTLMRSIGAVPEIRPAFFVASLSQGNAAPKHKGALVELNRESLSDNFLSDMRVKPGVALACRA